ncbi:nuclear distribution protein PAC1-like [Helianthus annuus]|uniref:nuclear distribution protein PAC1-like n=1 Tax=Helianthus annuus TaxID=4232 RepID=UPI000B909406|nr:nuclear distribution protein PAC1-like [Helianthus annuus]XP_022009427.1 nuclear distribution protein PAC1-like [Helianthus annuus]XP_022009428.1 nuclear distribution protein PAC1-like [Helianthus annuus]XP_022009429.1 nuclear distribution protein PAC1-like [Helianthus annuus]
MHYYHTLTTQFGCTIITVLPEDIYSSGDGFTFPLQMEYLADITINRAFDNRVGSKCSRADFDFSLNNQYLASSSLDKTVRAWDIPNGLCIRVIYGFTSQLCIRFHTVFNFSTGILISKIVVDGEVYALNYDHMGQFIFCGDSQGSRYSTSGWRRPFHIRDERTEVTRQLRMGVDRVRSRK